MTFSGQFELEFDRLLAELPRPLAAAPALTDSIQFDCVIAICGFEPRCKEASNALRRHGIKSRLAIDVHYADKELKEHNEMYLDDVHSALSFLCGSKPMPLTYDDHDLKQDFGAVLVARLEDEGLDLRSSNTRICFDITVGTSRLLLESLYALLQTGVSLTLLYAEADEYRPSFSEYMDSLEKSHRIRATAPEFLALGVDKIEVLRSIPGRNSDARPTYLAAFPSFTPMRIGAVIEELSPSRVHWLFGIPHLVKNRWRIDAQRNYHKTLIEPGHRHCYVSTFDYRETLQVLETIYRARRNEYTLFVCSLGSKLQKVGQVLFHVLRPEVGAVVSIPRTWEPDRFSSRTVRQLYTLDLGDLGNLRKKLFKTRTFRV